MKIRHLNLFNVSIPLHVPYITKLKSEGISTLNTIVCEVTDQDGRHGVGDTTIIPGYTDETVDSGWQFCLQHGERLVGMNTAEAKASLDPYRFNNAHAVSALQVAIEMLEKNFVFELPDEEVEVPILGAVNTKCLSQIPDQLEDLLEQGHRTLKVKVGWNPVDDLKRLEVIQKANSSRAKIRLDANQGFSREDAIEFSTSLTSDGDIQLFEQPCSKLDWASNEAVAAVSKIPVMMDESIYGFQDIERAATMRGCNFVKLKISKMTGVDLLQQGLNLIRDLGMTPVLGNGAASDIGCFVEACVARHTIDNAGENNGYLKNRENLIKNPLPFRNGSIILSNRYNPELDHKTINRLKQDEAHFASSQISVRTAS